MRTSTAAIIAVLTLVPSAALADDDAQPVQPRPVVVTRPYVQQPPTVVADDTGDGSGYIAPHFVPYLGGKIPDYAHIETKPDMTFIVSGASILGGTYAISLIYALATCGAQMDCRAGSNWLYVPIVGPFITAAMSPTSGGSALAAFDGGVQVLGAALAAAGFIAPKKFVMWQDKTAKLSITPTSGEGRGVSAGFAVTLTHM